MGSSSPPKQDPLNNIKIIVNQNITQKSLVGDSGEAPLPLDSIEAMAYIGDKQQPVNLVKNINYIQSDANKNDFELNNSSKNTEPNSNSIISKKRNIQEINEYSIFNNNLYQDNNFDKKDIDLINNENKNIENSYPPTDFGKNDDENDNNAKTDDGNNFKSVYSDYLNKQKENNEINKKNETDKGNNINNNEGSSHINNYKKNEFQINNDDETQLSISQSQKITPSEDTDKLAESHKIMEEGAFPIFLQIEDDKPQYFMIKEGVTLNNILCSKYKDNPEIIRKKDDIKFYYKNMLLDKNIPIQDLKIPFFSLIINKTENHA